MARPNATVEDVSEDFDVIGTEPDTDEGDDWNANEMMRPQGEPESEPLDDEDDDPRSDIDQALQDEEEALADQEQGPDDEDENEGPEESEDDELGAIDPPANWPEEVREKFGDLPPALQHWVYDTNKRMVADYTKKTQQVAQLRQAYSEIDRTIAPHVQKWALNGMNPASAIHQLIALSDFATENPMGFINYFANLRGINLSQLAPAESTEYKDPQVAALERTVAAVLANQNQAQQTQAQMQQAAQAAEYSRAFDYTNSQLDHIASQTGQDGKPLYPFFSELEEDMAVEISSGRAKTVHEAYERAKWANPQTRSKLLARSRATENAKARQRTEAARRAASSLNGSSSGTGSPSTESMSIRDIITGAMEGAL